MASNHSSVLEGTTISSKPWFLTFNEEYNELLIWKSGTRLKLKDGSTCGQVRSSAILDEANRILVVSCELDLTAMAEWHSLCSYPLFYVQGQKCVCGNIHEGVSCYGLAVRG